MFTHLLEVVVPQQVSGPQHVVVGEVWVQGAGRVGPLPALSDLLGGQGWLTHVQQGQTHITHLWLGVDMI